MQLLMPTVHANGTSADELIAVRSNAYDALQSAYVALKMSAPNGRDYYLHPNPDALQVATAQHMSRLQRIDDVMKELETEIEEIQKQIDDRSGA